MLKITFGAILKQQSKYKTRFNCVKKFHKIAKYEYLIFFHWVKANETLLYTPIGFFLLCS